MTKEEARATVVLVGTLDTKGLAYAYLRDRIREHGAEVLLIDAGVLGEPLVEPDIAREGVARAAGADIEQLARAGDRAAALEAMGREFATVRTGRASANLLDAVRVDYYGNPTPVNQMASVSVPDARTIMIQPWEATQLKAIEKAIQIADLGVNPQNDG